MLAVELADIGNLLLITPALAALRETYPDAYLDVLTTPHAAPILTGTSLVDNVICFDKFAFDRPSDLFRPKSWRRLAELARRLRLGHYDAVLIFHPLTTRFGTYKYAALAYASGAPRRAGLDNGRGFFLTDRVPDIGFSAKHQARYYLDMAALFGAKTLDERLRVGISNNDRAWAAAHLPTVVRLIAIHPGSGAFSPARRWEADKFSALADRFSEQSDVRIVLVGGKGDNVDAVLATMSHAESVINLAGQTTLNQLAAVLARCDHFYGADSGIMHLATAVGTPVTAVFGPSNHIAWGPWSPDGHATVARTGVRCSPCFYIDHTIGLRDGCQARTCLRTLTVEHVAGGMDGRTGPSVPSEEGEARISVPFPTIRILGVPVHAVTFAGMLDLIGKWVKGTTPHQICTANPEFLMAARRDVLFSTILHRADLCIPDGIGLLWAAYWLGHRLPERVTGSDGVPLIAERAAREGWRLFFLGAAPGVAAEAAKRLTARYPSLQVVGTYAGTPSGAEEDQIVTHINDSRADILFVAYGAPAQDKWIARNLPRLTPRVMMGVGGSFDFIAGVTNRAPVWMRQAGIEWLHRLIQQPWRWRRMTRLPRFVLAVLTTRR